MSKVFLNANILADFIKKEQDEVISNLCTALSCEPSTVSFLFDGSDKDVESLKIPRS